MILWSLKNLVVFINKLQIIEIMLFLIQTQEKVKYLDVIFMFPTLS